MSLKNLRLELKSHYDPIRAQHSQRFFKTAKGEYGHGDVFLGLNVPEQRKITKKYTSLSAVEIFKLLKSKIHEERFTALILLVHKYQNSDDKSKKDIYNQYLKNTKWINNWDLVDTSAPQIVGDYCLRHKDIKTLVRLAHSSYFWDRRIAIVATYNFIRHKNTKPTFTIAKTLLKDSHDLIHKAVGWMLREAGKKDLPRLKSFLDIYAPHMPRTMLRYSIEKLSIKERKLYLKIK